MYGVNFKTLGNCLPITLEKGSFTFSTYCSVCFDFKAGFWDIGDSLVVFHMKWKRCAQCSNESCGGLFFEMTPNACEDVNVEMVWVDVISNQTFVIQFNHLFFHINAPKRGCIRILFFFPSMIKVASWVIYSNQALMCPNVHFVHMVDVNIWLLLD